jgi:pimeloyl-ACP methyl ester carboxylesterase
MTMIQPFKVNISSQALDDLKVRLHNVRWPDEIKDSGWTYGTNLSYMKKLTDYWLNNFSWNKVEEEINAQPNFIATIDGYQIHFLHIKGKGKKSVPIIITHGWPGSFLEMMKLIPLLTDPMDFSFDLVIPSIPGFGFSGKVTQTGCNSAFVAGLWHKLMLELGYNKYGAQGGDIGAGISTYLGLKFPGSILGLHLNFISGSYKPFLKESDQLSQDVIDFQKQVGNWYSNEGAYAHQHSSKPITLSYGLNDSPVGLAAWIIEKFNSWSDNDGNIENVFTKDELLANIMLYWVTQSIHSSIRIYNENSKSPLIFRENDFVSVPVGLALFPKELPLPPREFIEKGFNIQHWTVMPSGGHFAAVEQPVLLSNDIVYFFKSIVPDFIN